MLYAHIVPSSCVLHSVFRARKSRWDYRVNRGEPINKYKTYLVIFENENGYGIYKIGKREGIDRQSVRWRITPSYSMKKNCLISMGFTKSMGRAKDAGTTDFHKGFCFFLESSQLYLIVFFIVRRCGNLSSSYSYNPQYPHFHQLCHYISPLIIFSSSLAWFPSTPISPILSSISSLFHQKLFQSTFLFFWLHQLLLNVPLMCSLHLI